ncbi:hypothetical protein pdam_00000144 [Pocillopora damicornis]|uniref:Uncharacterized protein n=1 Tax=Pocillopora damicornis TaxID=46731 RepID=A0A3M6UYC7_POCDA|nr:hypothetical protein pdam_00000144 [Pocillopora damicornis]
MKVKEPSSFRPSSSEMCDMLEKANLENRGFQKEVVRKSFQKPGRTGSDFEYQQYFIAYQGDNDIIITDNTK